MLEHNKNAFSPLKLRKHFNVVSDVAKPSLSRNMKKNAFQIPAAYTALLGERPLREVVKKGLGWKMVLSSCPGAKDSS